MDAEKIRKLISDNLLDEAMSALMQAVAGTAFEDEAILLKSDFKAMKDRERLQMSQDDEYRRMNRTFKTAFLQLLRNIEKGDSLDWNNLHRSENQEKKATPPPPPAKSTTDIILYYQGDPYGCGLQLQFSIGGKNITPMTNQVVLQDVPLGTQSYTISGMITCMMLGGSAMTTGQGQLIIVENGRYALKWRPSGFGMAQAWLEQG